MRRDGLTEPARTAHEVIRQSPEERAVGGNAEVIDLKTQDVSTVTTFSVATKEVHGTFSFLTSLYYAVFSVASARERREFWSTLPSKALMAALTDTILTRVGLPGLMPLPWWQTFSLYAYAMVSCLIVDDALKVVMIEWRVPSAIA